MTLRNSFTVCALVWAALSVGACKKDKPASDRAIEGLQQAREGIKAAQDSMTTMQSNTEALQKEIAEHTAQVNVLIDKRIELCRQEAAIIEQRAQNAPVAPDGELGEKLGKMKERQVNLEEKLKAYRDASPAEAESARENLNEAVAKFDEARAELEPLIDANTAPTAPAPAPEPPAPTPIPPVKPEPEPAPAPALDPLPVEPPPADPTPPPKPEALPAPAPPEPAPAEAPSAPQPAASDEQ